VKKILFRADAAPHIGIGDLMSLLNLSKYFSDCKIYFIIKNYRAGVELMAKHNAKNCYSINSDISIEEEVKFINSFINEKNIDMVFFEITERKLSDYVSISKDVKKVAVNFDEHILDDLSLLIDWDVSANKYFDVSKYPNTKFLLGPEFVILPKDFYSNKVLNRKNELNNKKLLIAMGGADEFNFTCKIVKLIIKYNLDFELNIIIGSGYEFRKDLEYNLKKSNLKYVIKENITNMLDEYLNCDIGIGAGGLTSSELIATKTSAILIATYKHQVDRCEYFSDMGWANYLGFKSFNEEDLISAIKNPIKPTGHMIFNTNKIKEMVDELL